MKLLERLGLSGLASAEAEPPVVHEGRRCHGGYVYVDEYNERIYGARRLGRADFNAGRRLVERCPVCAADDFVRRFGRKRMTWENWIDRPELDAALAAFAHWFPQAENQAVLIHGGAEPKSRLGRTHLLVAAALGYIRNRRAVRYWNCGDLAENKFAPYFPTIADFPGHALFDDLGNEADWPGNRDAVDRLLDVRYRNRRPSIVTTRLSLCEVEKRYRRFAARIIGGGLCIEWDCDPFERAEAVLADRLPTAAGEDAEPDLLDDLDQHDPAAAGG